MPDSFSTEDYALVGLSLIRGLGPHKIRLLLKTFGSADAVLGQPAAELLRIPGIGVKLAGSITRFDDRYECKRQFGKASDLGARFVRSDSVQYPILLRQIYDPPPFLWVAGTERISWEDPVAIVGTRRPTSYGRRLTRDIALGLAKEGVVVISGLAHGVDAVAHETVVRHGGQTIAFLGSGLDRIYPRNHIQLARDIRENGCLVSPFPFGTEPDGPNFPQRNRLISGSTRATIVTEAYASGGALITAKFALDQNRDVYALPGPVNSPASEGTNTLIRDGTARLLLSATETLRELSPELQASHLDNTLFRTLDPRITNDERRVLQVLDYSPRHLDEICEDVGENPGRVLSLLLHLELAGCVQDCGGKLYARH